MTHPGPRSLLFAVLQAAVLGCGHTDPFLPPDHSSDQPFNPGPPVQLTLNRGADRRPAWLPDGSSLIYSTQPQGRPDDDVCLAALSASGGRQRWRACDLTSASSTITDALESAAPAADGRLAFVAAVSPVRARNPDAEDLVLGSMDDPTGRQHLLSIPYSASGGGPHTGVSQLRWLSPGRLIFLGESVIRSSPCLGCEMDTVRSGLGVVIMDVDQSPISPVQVPSTDYASGVSPGTTEDEIYYTLGGDTRVYRRILSSGEVAVAHDFGAGGIARDVHVVGSRLAAVVGGRVAFGIDPVHGPTQWDSGGTLRVVNIQNGTEQTLTGPGLFRRPQLSPSGTAIVAEVYPLIVTVDTVTQDTVVVVGRDSDLYLYQQP